MHQPKRSSMILSLVTCGFLAACGSSEYPEVDLQAAALDAAQLQEGGVLDLASTAVDSNVRGTVNPSKVDISAAATEPVVTGTCPAASAPAAVKTVLVAPSRPIAVPTKFMGIHRSLNNPHWVANPYAEIPAPKYGYDYARTLKADVGGESERGFWSNIETSPGVYNWSAMDKWMQANAGRAVVWTIYGTPTMYQKYPNEPSRYPSWRGIASPPADAAYPALANFARAVKARYGSQIAAFEVWNEPTFPWTATSTPDDARWSPSWASVNFPQNPAPYFSGSPSDLANIAYTLNKAGLGVPIIGAGFVDQWKSGDTSVDKFLKAPVTLAGGSGTGKDHIQAMSMHFYDYSFDPAGLVSAIDGYRAKLTAVGLGSMPIWGTETGAEDGGVFSANDPRAPVNIQRWVLLAAAKGLKSMILYGHVSGSDALRYLGDPINNTSVIASLDRGHSIAGKVICNAAILNDGRVWITTQTGDVYAI